MIHPNCPGCAKPLQKVKQSPNSMLNAEQFDAARAGDWFCETCPGNGEARTGYRYFWDKDLTSTATAAAKAPAAQADYTVDDSELARKIMVFMGRATTASMEPGADPLRDRLAERLALWRPASPASTPEASQQAAIGSSASELECLQVKYGLMKTTYEVEIAQLRGSQAEPIYQVQFVEQSGTSAWNDATEDAYNTFMPERRRIVYPAATAAAATECEACEVKTSEDIQSSTDARDAARYRWLSRGAWGNHTHPEIKEHLFAHVSPDALDAAIDAAMRATQQEGE